MKPVLKFLKPVFFLTLASRGEGTLVVSKRTAVYTSVGKLPFASIDL